MKKLEEVKNALTANELLSTSATSGIKGGTSDATDDEKRRQRPGGGISTNGSTLPNNFC
jgi:hypothetical protein